MPFPSISNWRRTKVLWSISLLGIISTIIFNNIMLAPSLNNVMKQMTNTGKEYVSSPEDFFYPKHEIESFLISFHHTNVLDFAKRNAKAQLSGDYYHTFPSVTNQTRSISNYGTREEGNEENQQLKNYPLTWFPAINGKDQKMLDLFAELTNLNPINGSDERIKKDDYNSPHAVGCYLAHWHLLRLLEGRKSASAYIIFEDDCNCVDNVIDKTIEMIQNLPDNWDMLFIGGKPFTYFPKGQPRMVNGTVVKHDFEMMRDDACNGEFGKAAGPLAPDGSRNLSADQPYWQTKYTTNLHAYVVNPQKIDKILRVIDPTTALRKSYKPIDIVLGDAMRAGKLNVYMPPIIFCKQGRDNWLETLDKPYRGYHHVPQIGFIWGDMILNCSY